ncbi:MAG: hypothetical protein VX181_17230, partial [Pseudomonadota bacterium]|nr:hypothetical protein [Pseudomonadota bacterium]
METHERIATRAWVLHPDLKTDKNRREADYALEEAVSLAAALPDLEVVGSTKVPLPRAHAGYLFGSGKIEELKQLADASSAAAVADVRKTLAEEHLEELARSRRVWQEEKEAELHT